MKYRISLQVGVAGLLACLIALPCVAQSTGMIRGVVKDEKGQPVEGAKVSIDFAEGVNRHLETKSDKRGQFTQIGLAPGVYKVTAEKDKVGSMTQETRVRVGQSSELTFQLTPAGPSKETAAKNDELRKTFEAGVQASRAGRYEEATKSFEHAVELDPNCAECYFNLGHDYAEQKDYEKAEGAFKKAIELKPEFADAYNGLANVYNAQRKFDQAAAASTKATELGAGGGAGASAGNAVALYNNGVVLWNAGKIPEAKAQFQAAIQANPNHAESHYQLGMAFVNEGNLAQAVTEFETYLKLAPDGANAAQAKALVAQLKK